MSHVAESPTPAPAPEPAGAPGWAPPKWAYTTFSVLFLMHLLDYTDRWALSGVQTLLQADLGITNEQSGGLNVPFLLTFSLVSPITGWLGDRFRRTYMLAFGVGVWSLATVGTGFARNYDDLWWARGVLGLGEATYGVLAPAMLMDLFRRETRSRVLSGFYLAMPLGYAAGVAGGGLIAGNSPAWFAGTALAPWAGWRMAFLIVGFPGLLAAIATLFLPEPRRGASEGVDMSRPSAGTALPTRADYVDLMVNSSYTYCVFGMTAFTFAFGGLAYWLPTYLEKVKGFTQGEAVVAIGLCGLGASALGMTAGGILADRLARKDQRALFVVPGVAMLLAVPLTLLGLYAHSKPLIVASMFLAMMFMFVNTGPCSAVIANVVTPNIRALAYSVSIFAVHMLGDLWSPWLMGKVADYTARPHTMETFLGTILRAVRAEPTASGNLTAGMLVVVPAIALGGIVLLAGARHLPGEMALMVAKLRARGPAADPPA